MTSSEIAKLQPKSTGSRNCYPERQESDYRDFQLELLREIAFQLAVMNERGAEESKKDVSRSDDGGVHGPRGVFFPGEGPGSEVLPKAA